MNFDVHAIRRQRKALQWSVVPMGILTVLILSHPIIPLAICFIALGTLSLAVLVGTVEEQVGAHGSPWLWRKAKALPRRVGTTQPPTNPPPGYRVAWVEPERPKMTRHAHSLTVVVAFMPVGMGGCGLGWRLVRREMKREVEVWRAVIVRRVEEWSFRDFVRSTHVGCTGRTCDSCNDIIAQRKSSNVEDE